jgi:hypothetical protein
MNRGQKTPYVSTEYRSMAVEKSSNVAHTGRVPTVSCCDVAPAVHPYQQIFLQASNVGRYRVATNSPIKVRTKQPFLMMGGTTESSTHPRLRIQTQHGPALLMSPIETSDAVAQQRLANTSNAPATTARKIQRWSKEEDAILMKATRNEIGPKYAWALIAYHYFSNSRTAIQCKSRWTKVRRGCIPTFQLILWPLINIHIFFCSLFILELSEVDGRERKILLFSSFERMG